jgi:hypothetical protein
MFGMSWMTGTLAVTAVVLVIVWRAGRGKPRPYDPAGRGRPRPYDSNPTDARWWLASLASVIASPLGWAYYLVLGLGPAVAHLAANGRPTLLFGAGWIGLLAIWISALPLPWCTWIWTAGALCWAADAFVTNPRDGS